MEDSRYKKRALQRLLIFGAVAVLSALGLWYISRQDVFQKLLVFEPAGSSTLTQEVSPAFSAPEPLMQGTSSIPGDAKVFSSGPDGEFTLTREGVIAETNRQRMQNGNLASLSENKTLDDIAMLRLEDMFTKQYFAHVSPSGSSAITVAATVGYANLALGENLALGNFLGDGGVVTAWMNSPGHRANILDVHYTQIGVAVGEGIFQGGKAWIAVQIFGRPAADCVVPSFLMKTTITSGQAQIETDQAQLQSIRVQLSAMEPKSDSVYMQAVESYNALVDQYNALVTTVQSKVTQYNAAITAYNACLAA